MDLALRVTPPILLTGRRAPRILERKLMVYRRMWIHLISGFFEPLFYLLSIRVGLGKLVGNVVTDGHAVSYAIFVAPALLAASAMNGAIYDSTFNVFFNLKYAKTYDAILATPMAVGDVAVGEVAWALLRGLMYAVAFLVVMAALGLVQSFWAVLALPAATLIGFAFGGMGMAATSYMRTWLDFEFVQPAIMPLFLFSAAWGSPCSSLRRSTARSTPCGGRATTARWAAFPPTSPWCLRSTCARTGCMVPWPCCAPPPPPPGRSPSSWGRPPRSCPTAPPC